MSHYIKVATILSVLLYTMKFALMMSIFIVLFMSFFGAVFFTNRAFNKKIKNFLDNFMYALDIIVRGARSGLALNLCFKQVVDDIDIVVGEQFLAIIDDYRLGMPTETVMERFIERLPLNEVTFFALSIMIQGKTGGNLAEVIANLAKILRNRKSLLLKIQTLSSEAKTTATIIGALPVGVMGLLALVAPEYVGILFHTSSGQNVLIGCALWMGLGRVIMNHMINFYK